MLIYCPVKSCVFTQRFGENLNNFYSQLGLLGHNGYDFRALSGEELIFNVAGTGEVIEVSDSATYGKRIVVMTKDSDGSYYKHYYGHLMDFNVKEGNIVKLGDLLGHTDNTGMFTTGAHLHYGLYKCTSGAKTLNRDNGYDGSIDPTKFYVNVFAKIAVANIKAQVSIIQKLIDLMKEFWTKIK